MRSLSGGSSRSSSHKTDASQARTVNFSYAVRSILTFLIICPRARQKVKEEKHLSTILFPSPIFCRREGFSFLFSYLPLTIKRYHAYVSIYMLMSLVQKEDSNVARLTSTEGILTDVSAPNTTTSHTATCNRRATDGPSRHLDDRTKGVVKMSEAKKAMK